jgi:hypothetical protein
VAGIPGTLRLTRLVKPKSKQNFRETTLRWFGASGIPRDERNILSPEPQKTKGITVRSYKLFRICETETIQNLEEVKKR